MDTSIYCGIIDKTVVFNYIAEENNMFSDEQKIKEVLKTGKEILSSRPELASMKLCDVINELDDGTSEMIHNRWGVAAWVVTNSIKNFETKALVEQLSKVDSGPLTYEYVGYLLLTEYGVNLEDLLLQAERCSQFDKIVSFIIENLVYEEKLYEKNVLPILQVLENHLAHQFYHSFLWNYAKHIERLGAQGLIENQIGEIDGQAQYDLMTNLCAGWYASNEAEASKVLERLLDRKGIWNKKAAIKYLRVSLYYNKEIFQKHFAQIEAMALTDDQLWLMIIPLYIEYICIKTDHAWDDIVQRRVFEYLKKIPSGSLNARYSFLEFIQCVKDVPEELHLITIAILSRPFDKEQRFLNILDHLLYIQTQKGDWHKALKLMQAAFAANRYSEDYETFFHSMNLLRREILTYTKDITCQALEHILSGDIERLFFGLGLLMSFGSIKELYEVKPVVTSDPPFELNTSQIIQIEKAILYFTVDTQKVCQVAFQLLELVSGEVEQYMAFCLEEVFEDYSTTMYKTAKEYQDSMCRTQVELSQRVIQAYDQQIAAKKKCYAIMDLRPSREHLYVYRKALAEQNRQICKQANKKSFFGQMFKMRKLKYGVRSAYTIIGRKGEKIFQVNPYAHIQHEMELPALYIRDPVSFELRRQAYIEEVKSNASNHKGIFASTEREG